MGYKERMLEQVTLAEHRPEERQELWHAILEAFDEEGPDGVEKHLAGRMKAIEGDFDELMAKLETML